MTKQRRGKNKIKKTRYRIFYGFSVCGKLEARDKRTEGQTDEVPTVDHIITFIDDVSNFEIYSHSHKIVAQ